MVSSTSKQSNVMVWSMVNGQLLYVISFHIEKGHEVIRLTLNHFQYNAIIELIWARVKRRVAKYNNTFKMVDIERLTHEALDVVTKEHREKCVRHAERLQELDSDALMKLIILTTLPDVSDFSDEESDIEQLE
ncbi:Uncharacterized protein FWK35_00025817 [Aphis craccivora]|uniref:Uncharacterized protein n=1 Tax=Aphis craccivora TaxID=307492 RepID=A0A6G0YBV3_APHCR|nr:Uncharacterized protein FWK35_00025817 [Aphis craccivora]